MASNTPAPANVVYLLEILNSKMDLLPEIKQEISEFNTLLKIRQEAKSNRNNFEQEHQEQFTKFQATMVKHPAPDIAVMTKTTAESMSSSKKSSNKTIPPKPELIAVNPPPPS